VSASARRRAARLLATAIAAVAALAGAATTASAAQTDRIVSLNGDITEVIYALGYGGRLVGVDVSATYPPEASRLPKIGYQRTLSAEPILALRPTMIVGSPLAGPPAVIEQLEAIGQNVRILPEPRGLNEVGLKIRRIGKLLGGRAAARSRVLARSVQRQINNAKRRVVARKKPRVAFLYLRGTRVQQIAGAGSGGDAMISAAGGIDVGRQAGITGYRQLTPEGLVQMKPDVIVTLTAGLQSVGGVQGLLQIPGVAQTPAGRDGRILSFDDQEFLGLGPRAPRALRALIRGLGTDKR